MVLCIQPACNLIFSLGWVSRAKVAVAGCHSGSLHMHQCVLQSSSTWIKICFSSTTYSLLGLDGAQVSGEANCDIF